jgi:thiol-disulfide isomerase/thioredoxin
MILEAMKCLEAMKLGNRAVLFIGLGLLALSHPLVGASDVSSLETAVCNVCRVHEGETEPEAVMATAEHGGQTYGFCSAECRDKFLEEPTAYLPPVLPRPSPPFEALDLEGAAFSSQSLQGQWTLLDFWATWCQPCIADLPKLTALHERYSERGFAVVSLSIDEGKGAAKKVARMIKRQKAAHPVYLDSGTAPAWSAFNVRVVPTQFLISPEGQIVAQWSGSIDLQEVEDELTKALGGG